ncbi:DUF4365 domain-containing protein [Aliiglaciecola sp. CAU 1673]|uniref:DUF4365 domain-containing protein n=1 Tax=Aliiglaciecola sp. CAU 1673 TaxID=3032595 RepID=UPI0023DAA9A1|nr:DUF4365 domain-containing protein [Aliiglaciecola sp. CAU 1673]MDF2176868.1 DUF4365 domain-containing protein [Aliiglaciecola sp. CAU 1673]
MPRKQRSLNQVKEDISIRVLREKLPLEWVVHSYGADYGIDCVIELFDFIDEEKKTAETLGENFFVQLKSSDCIEYATRKVYSRGNVAKGKLNEDKEDYTEIEVAKFQLDMSDILTIQSMGIAIPVLLILVDTNSERAFFVCLNDYIDKVLIPEDPDYASKGTKTIFIPMANEIMNHEDALVSLRVYGKRSKMYGAFSLFNYQLKEILRMQGKAAMPNIIPLEYAINMLKNFVDIALRQDIWSGHEFWKPMEWSHTELIALKEKLHRGIKEEDSEKFITYCSDYIWHRLTNLSNMYEELVREWFLPTYLAKLTSYPPKADTDTA